MVDPPADFNLARHCLELGLNRHPDKPAVIFVETEPGAADTAAHSATGLKGAPASATEYTYADLHRLSAALMQGLAYALPGGPPPKGSRILLRLPHSPAFGLFFLAVIRMGCIAVPSSPRLTTEELEVLIEDSEPSLVITGGGLPVPSPGSHFDFTLVGPEKWQPWLEASVTGTASARKSGSKSGTESVHRLANGQFLGEYDVPTLFDDPAFLIYTSGTSGKPKGVLHAQRSLYGRRPMYKHWLDLRPDDRLLHAGEFNWTYTLGVGFCDPLTVGATSVLYGGPRDKASVWLNLIEENHITLFAAVPGIYRRLLKYTALNKSSVGTLRHGLTAGEALSPALYHSWVEHTGKPLYEALGMSEISTYISSGPTAPTQPGSPGKPQPGRKVAILPQSLLEGGPQAIPAASAEPVPTGEVGLLAVHRSDPGLMLDYWRIPDGEQQVFFGDWFAGGDLAAFDSDGYIHYHGRLGDVLNAGGYRTSPLEIERVIHLHPAVADVAVGAVPIEDGLTLLVAFVVIKEGPPNFKDGELKELCLEHLADYKVPREFVTVDDLPRLRSGKLARRQLGDLYRRLKTGG